MQNRARQLYTWYTSTSSLRAHDDYRPADRGITCTASLGGVTVVLHEVLQQYCCTPHPETRAIGICIRYCCMYHTQLVKVIFDQERNRALTRSTHSS